MCLLLPDYTENIIVATVYNKEFSWFVTDKEIWYLDYKKRIDLFKESGYIIKEEYIDDARQGLLLVDSSNADIFLKKISEYKVLSEQLKKLLINAKSMDDDTWKYDFRPSLFVDFDKKVLYSCYAEPASYQDYVPENWESEYKEFKEIIPDEEKYWLDENQKSYLE